MKWLKTNPQEWSLYRDHEWQKISLAKSYGQRFLYIHHEKQLIDKKTFHYYHQHPESLLMETLL